MKNIIFRLFGGLVHALNVSTGATMSFEMTSEEMERMIEFPHKFDSELEEEVKSFFLTQGKVNTRLCRSNLNELGMTFGFPTMVNLEIIQRCSLRCIHCYIGNARLSRTTASFFEKMSGKEMSNFLDELHVMGVFLLVFTGGEPFLSPSLEPFVKMANDKGFVLEIFTNLQFLPTWIMKLGPEGLRIGRIQVSVYSADSQTHDKITTRSGSFHRTIRNIDLLRSLGFYIEVATPLMLANFDTRVETARMFSDKGIPQNFSWPIVDEYYSSNSGKSELNITPDQLRQFIEENPDFLIKTCFTDKPNEPICEAGRSLFSITADGKVFPCSQFPCSVGDICRQRISEVYDSGPMLKVRNLRNIDTGVDVAYNYCIGGNYSETGDPLKQSEFFVGSLSSALKKERR